MCQQSSSSYCKSADYYTQYNWAAFGLSLHLSQIFLPWIVSYCVLEITVGQIGLYYNCYHYCVMCECCLAATWSLASDPFIKMIFHFLWVSLWVWRKLDIQLIFRACSCQHESWRTALKCLASHTEGRCRSVQQEAEMRQRLWNRFGNTKIVLYCRFRTCTQLNHKGAGIAGVKPYCLQFKKSDISPLIWEAVSSSFWMLGVLGRD